MEVESAERFLNLLSSFIQEGGDVIPKFLELPRAATAGFTGDRDDIRDGAPDSDYEYAVYGDGLALLGSPHPREVGGYWIWSPKEGMVRKEASFKMPENHQNL